MVSIEAKISMVDFSLLVLFVQNSCSAFKGQRPSLLGSSRSAAEVLSQKWPGGFTLVPGNLPNNPHPK
jgi:hypothetical protein